MTDLDLLLLQRHVEAALAPWRQDGPGVTVGVVLGGQLAVHRSAGLAQVEFGVPIGADTRFRIASVSKQFTCAAILMLAEAGLVDLAAPARRYVPELPDTGERVTVDHLMHNTAGIRDMLEILRFGGVDLGMPVRSEDLLEGICRQRTLNFAPGTRYLYSNSNFLLLGLIVERITGEALGDFLQARIFGPLGMADTALTPSVGRAVERLATGYFPAEGAGWVRAAHAFPLGGEGGLVSSVADLALWVRNFETRRVGGVWLDGLKAQAPFRNGLENRYARGLIGRAHRGVMTWSHGGLWPGYRTELLMAPAAEASVIVIANVGSADPSAIAHRVLDAVLDGRGAPAAPALPDRAALARMEGRWLDPEGGETMDIVLADGAPSFVVHGVKQAAEASGDGWLAAARSSSVLAARLGADDALEVEQDAGVLGRWRRVAAGGALPEGLAGRYHSAEMAADWVIDGEGVRATGPVARGPVWEMEAVEGDLFRVVVPLTLYRGWLDVRAVREAGRVVGLVASGGRVKQVRFERVA